jgi:hypothetical protein
VVLDWRDRQLESLARAVGQGELERLAVVLESYARDILGEGRVGLIGRMFEQELEKII